MKPGDKVKYIDNDVVDDELTLNKVYEIKAIEGTYILIENDSGRIWTYEKRRFVLYDPLENLTWIYKRHMNRRFWEVEVDVKFLIENDLPLPMELGIGIKYGKYTVQLFHRSYANVYTIREML